MTTSHMVGRHTQIICPNIKLVQVEYYRSITTNKTTGLVSYTETGLLLYFKITVRHFPILQQFLFWETPVMEDHHFEKPHFTWTNAFVL